MAFTPAAALRAAVVSVRAFLGDLPRGSINSLRRPNSLLADISPTPPSVSPFQDPSLSGGRWYGRWVYTTDIGDDMDEGSEAGVKAPSEQGGGGLREP